MRALFPLLKDFITRLESDGLLKSLTGASALKVYTERPPDTAAMPFLVLDMISASPWSSKSWRGTDYVIQVSAFFARTERGGLRGLAQTSKAMERIRDVLEHVDGFELTQSPAEGESVGADFISQSYESEAPGERLVARFFESAQPPRSDPAGGYLMATCRFRCWVGDNT